MTATIATAAPPSLSVLAGCLPRADVLKEELDDALFAASLEAVIRGTAPAVYQEAATFFRNSSWMRSTDRRASTTRKPNSSAIELYSRSSLF